MSNRFRSHLERAALTFIAGVVLFSSSYGIASDHPDSMNSHAASDEQVGSDASAEKKTHEKEKPKAVYSAGVVYGRIAAINSTDRTITVVLLSSDHRRATFFLDRSTQYKIEKRRANFTDIAVGQKVAIRFFGEDELSVAEAVYVVKGEFHLKDYQPIKKKRAAAPAAAAPEGGHH